MHPFRNGTVIDLFVLIFMCILTKLSESLNQKQKRGYFLSCCFHAHHGAGVSKPQPGADLSAVGFCAGGNHHTGGFAGSARHMAVRNAAFGAVLYLLQRNVEPVGRTYRPFEPKQLSEPHH